MKYEFGAEKPERFRQYWPGQYDFFSYMEYACGIPEVLFAITTRKADGKPNWAAGGFVRRGPDRHGDRSCDPHGDGRGLCERLR